MARDTDTVPRARVRTANLVRWMQQNGTTWDPSLFVDKIGAGKLAEEPTMAGSVPVLLLLVGAGHEYDLTCDLPWLPAWTSRIRIVKSGPEFSLSAIKMHWTAT